MSINVKHNTNIYQQYMYANNKYIYIYIYIYIYAQPYILTYNVYILVRVIYSINIY